MSKGKDRVAARVAAKQKVDVLLAAHPGATAETMLRWAATYMAIGKELVDRVSNRVDKIVAGDIVQAEAE